MKFRELLNLPTATELGDFGKTEFKNGIADIRRALIEEGWFGQSMTGLGWELPEGRQADISSHDPLHERLSGQDKLRSMAERDHEQELDFDR